MSVFTVRNALWRYLTEYQKDADIFAKIADATYAHQQERAGRSERRMKIRTNQNGIRCIHIDDADDYEVTDDNGVDFWPTKKQLDRIVKMHIKHPSTKGGDR